MSNFKKEKYDQADILAIKENLDIKQNLMDKKVHSNAKKKEFPKWPNWTPEQAKILDEHCRKNLIMGQR